MEANETEQSAQHREGADPTASPDAPRTPAAALETMEANDMRIDAAEQLRVEFAEIANVAAQAARLGIQVHVADAVRKGISAEALRRSVLETLAARAEAANVIAAAPATPTAGESPIVRRAKERAAANRL